MVEKSCVVCGDFNDVKNHYGVVACYGCKAFFRRTISENRTYFCAKNKNCAIEKDSRNHCRFCRFQKCLEAGMEKNNLRDFTKNSKTDLPRVKLPVFPTSKSSNLIDFLTSMTKNCLEAFDPKFAVIDRDVCQKMDSFYGRHVSLAEGLRNPQLVCPRTKFDWSFHRPFETFDLSFMWYRFFVAVADWATNIPQFRMLPLSDQLQLMRLNFVHVYNSIIMYFVLENGIWEDKIPFGNGSFLSKNVQNSMLSRLVQGSIRAYESHLFRPMFELEMDRTEIALLAAILLFQYHEDLTSEGRGISANYLDKLFDAFFEHQNNRFPKKSPLERSRRQSRILMLTSKMSQIWATESDVHLMITTFDGLNIDGIPKELLFRDFDFKKM